MSITRLCAQLAFANARATFAQFCEWEPCQRTVLRMVDAVDKTGPGNKAKREKLLEVLQHLSKHVHHMRYHELRRADLDIAIGAAEGAVRNLHHHRLSGTHRTYWARRFAVTVGTQIAPSHACRAGSGQLGSRASSGRHAFSAWRIAVHSATNASATSWSGASSVPEL